MPGENDHKDYKHDIDINDPGHRLALFKHVAALANSGGGEIHIGYTNTGDIVGVPATRLAELDGAEISNRITPFITPASVGISHSFEELDGGNYIIVLYVSSVAKYPVVFARDGDHGNRNMFRKGDIYVRHGAKSERATYADIVAMMDRASDRFRDEIIQRIDRLVRLPDGIVLRPALPTGEQFDEPDSLLKTMIAKRSTDKSVILSGRELLWCWVQRGELYPDDAIMDMLIRSALRRTPTLFLWLYFFHDHPEIVAHTLLDTLGDKDRDISDSGNSLLEVAAFYLDTAKLNELLQGMRNSGYAHLTEAVHRWEDREHQIERFRNDLNRVSRFSGKDFAEGVPELLKLSDRVASDLLIAEESQRPGNSRKLTGIRRLLGNIGRAMFLSAFDRVGAETHA